MKSRLKPTYMTIAVCFVCKSFTLVANEVNNDEAKFEVIEVTSQKRVQNSQEVPISMQAFGEGSLEQLGVAELDDLTRVSPSLQFGGVPGSRAKMGIRGVVDSGRNVGVDSRTGIYIDGVYQGRSASNNQHLLGIQSVEVLRGPQGTLFGKNTVSGAININTKKATEYFESKLKFEAGNFGHKQAQLYINSGLTDNLFGSISLSKSDRGGFYQNELLDKEVGGLETESVRAQLRYQPSDKLEVMLNADYGSTYSTDPLAQPLDLNPILSAFYPNLEEVPSYTIYSELDYFDEVEYSGASLQLNYTTDSGFAYSSITASRSSNSDLLADDDYTPLELLSNRNFGEDYEQFSQEFRIVSPKTDNFDWIAGIYYFDSDTSTVRETVLGADAINTLVVPSLPASLQSLISDNAEALAGYGFIPSEVQNETMALYANANYRFTQKLELNLGLRYTKEDKSIEFSQINRPNDPATAEALENAIGGAIQLTQSPGLWLGGVNILDVEDSRSATDLSPTVGINYKQSDDVMFFAKYARAFQSGGWNADFKTNGLGNFAFDDETVNNIEAGVKATLLDDNLRINASVFSASYSDYQIFQYIPIEGQTVSALELTNAGEVDNSGVELEASYWVTEDFQLTLNATLLDPVYTKYENITFDNEGNEVSNDFSGNLLAYAPEVKFYVAATYNQEVSLGTVTYHLDYSYTGDNYADAANLDSQLLDAWGLVNARVTMTSENEKWSVSAFVNNLQDEEYITEKRTNPFNWSTATYGMPRFYGISLSYNWF
ncbi:TonB-dependent receptor [uncultured Paraglaciecola sp.]|uniref:TonB-dependent receptor n=1 Tax=uncultured Paraglaciecola sp. TaxID=1765024 RepID=UPI0025931EDC|nr:TonB-dependent receptor [uncultured Paraglaciecola sp.]